MGQRIVTVDAFAEERFSGNPAAVCVMPGPADESWMQLLAREMNLSETAFLYPVEGGYHLRWFTPGAEVPLCGHATLAGAHVLWEEGFLPPDAEARFHTLSGLLLARRDSELIELNFPRDLMEPCEPPAELLRAVGRRPRRVLRNALRYMLEFDSAADVRALRPDLSVIAALPVQGVIVTAAAGSAPYDIVSRYFAPRVGVNEDPVTGSAHCTLAPYWGERLGKTELLAYQASPRGGVLRLRLDGDRVRMAGRAITVLRGELA